MSGQANAKGVRDGTPAGVPLGRALIVRPGIANDDLRSAISAIERVHGDGELPPIPMLLSRSLASPGERPADGAFRVVEVEDQAMAPTSIQLRSDAHNIQYLALHEIGHFLDASGLPGTGYSFKAHSALGGWRRAATRSHANLTLEALVSSGDAAVSARAAVLLPTVEVWARSYAQFIIVRGGNASLLRSLDALRRREPDDLYFPRQWDDSDFAEIETAIDELFRRLGWIA